MEAASAGGRALRRCFVISPIGTENSDTRRHADTIYNCIIRPACEPGQDGGATYTPERGDHKTAPGKITDQIYEDILDADLIIVVLTGNNPNVYYELAIAQSAAKPVILLMEKGFDAPFDIKDHRIIYYDFDPQRIYQGAYIEQLRAAILSLETRRSRLTVPFAPDLAPLGDPLQAIYQRASEAEGDAIRLISTAEKFVWLTGYTLNGWTMNQSFMSALDECAERLGEKSLRIMLVAPDNPSLKSAMKTKDIFEATRQSAKAAQGSWRGVLAKRPGKKHQLRISRTRSINYQMMLSEREALVVPYLTSRDTLRSPYIYARRESFYHDALVEEFGFLWGEAQAVNLTRKRDTPAKRSKRRKRA